MEEFNTGFTKKSYFNIIKCFVEGVYGKSFDLAKLDFNFRVSKKVNAGADYYPKGNYDLLTINTETIVKIMEIVKTAFAHKNILCRFGNANIEENSVFVGEYKYQNNTHSLVFRAQSDINDSCRRMLSENVAFMAIRFIFTHEVGHIVNGHTRFKNDMYGESKICMIENGKNDNLQYCLDRRTLEMDADATAATYSIDNILLLYENNRKYLKQLQIKSIDDLLELWGFSIACVFMLFEHCRKTTYDKYDWYLPNDARYKTVIGAAWQEVLSYMNNDIISYHISKDVFDSAVKNGLDEAEKVIRIFDKEALLAERIERDCDKYEIFYHEVEENWKNNIRARLEPYSRTVLYSEVETERAIAEMKRREDRKHFIRFMIKKIKSNKK